MIHFVKSVLDEHLDITDTPAPDEHKGRSTQRSFELDDRSRASCQVHVSAYAQTPTRERPR
ncbi:hypothetical protein L6R29_01530 [Myxococcota bacterium]|nr:hypothetical protein [Myxococcota bacterium]